jgi:ribonuclease BN (tRNA processing enzyme)
MYQMGIPCTDIDFLFFTHYHSDHMSDYPCFLMTRFDMSIGAEGDLTVYGPPPVKDITERLWGKERGVFWLDVVARTQHPMSVREFHRRGGAGPRLEPVVHVHECCEGEVASGKNWGCYAHQVDHAQPYLESLGYRFETEEGVIAFTGDAEPNEKVIELGRNADMLVINALGGVAGAAGAAKEAGAKRLTVVHQPYGLGADEAIEEAKLLFGGQVYGGKDEIEISW